MGCVRFPRIEMLYASKMFTVTLKKICTEVTHDPETEKNSKIAHDRGTSPKTIPVHKSESVKATWKK